MASSAETHGQRKTNHPYLFKIYLFNLLAGLVCWIWFYILDHEVYDGKEYQLFAEGKENSSSLASIHRKSGFVGDPKRQQLEGLALPASTFSFFSSPSSSGKVSGLALTTVHDLISSHIFPLHLTNYCPALSGL